jgi:hypothetical protein
MKSVYRGLLRDVRRVSDSTLRSVLRKRVREAFQRPALPLQGQLDGPEGAENSFSEIIKWLQPVRCPRSHY